MNCLSLARRTQIVGLLAEGTGLRDTSRLADVSINTVTRLLVNVGSACGAYQDVTLQNLPCRRIQCDEIRVFVYAKQKNVTRSIAEAHADAGDVWTWTAIDADTKLVPSWLVGSRDAQTAFVFVSDLARRLRHRVQLTTDGHKPYLSAVEDTCSADANHAVLQKLYGADPGDERRYSPATRIGARSEIISGDPNPKHISTSYVERQNLPMRMHMRRFTRLTNAFSKKVENHTHAVALHFMHYNFAKIHKTLRVTPAIQAGVADHVWSFEEIARLGN